LQIGKIPNPLNIVVITRQALLGQLAGLLLSSLHIDENMTEIIKAAKTRLITQPSSILSPVGLPGAQCISSKTCNPSALHPFITRSKYLKPHVESLSRMQISFVRTGS
jgi:hypothetical protein